MQMPTIFLYLHLRDIFLVQFQSPLRTWINPSSFFCLQCTSLFIHCFLSVVVLLCDLLLYSSSAAKGIFESHLCSWTMVLVIYVFLGAADLSLNYSGLMWIKLLDNLGFCSGFVLLVLQGGKMGDNLPFLPWVALPKSVGLVLGCKLLKSVKRHPC